MEIRSPVAYQAKLGMSVNVLLQQSLTTADKKQQVERLFSNIPLADLKPSHQAVLDYVNGTVSDTMSHLPEYATLLGRLLTESSRFGDAIFVLEKALVANHAVDSKPINQIRHQLALVRSLEQLEQRKSVILHNNLTALLST
jgi:hypothetical protein